MLRAELPSINASIFLSGQCLAVLSMELGQCVGEGSQVRCSCFELGFKFCEGKQRVGCVLHGEEAGCGEVDDGLHREHLRDVDVELQLFYRCA